MQSVKTVTFSKTVLKKACVSIEVGINPRKSLTVTKGSIKFPSVVTYLGQFQSTYIGSGNFEIADRRLLSSTYTITPCKLKTTTAERRTKTNQLFNQNKQSDRWSFGSSYTNMWYNYQLFRSDNCFWFMLTLLMHGFAQYIAFARFKLRWDEFQKTVLCLRLSLSLSLSLSLVRWTATTF